MEESHFINDWGALSAASFELEAKAFHVPAEGSFVDVLCEDV